MTRFNPKCRHCNSPIENFYESSLQDRYTHDKCYQEYTIKKAVRELRSIADEIERGRIHEFDMNLELDSFNDGFHYPLAHSGYKTLSVSWNTQSQ